MSKELEKQAKKLAKRLSKYVMDRSIYPGNRDKIEVEIVHALEAARDQGRSEGRYEAAKEIAERELGKHLSRTLEGFGWPAVGCQDCGKPTCDGSC